MGIHQRGVAFCGEAPKMREGTPASSASTEAPQKAALMDVHSRKLMTQLPYLRRYARALTGTPEAGDELVAVAIEQVLDQPAAFALEEGGRGPLYALLNRLFDAQGGEPATPATGHPMETALALLPEPERRLFLLVSLEELHLPDAAEVLGVTPAEAAALMTSAQDGLREALIASIMIVEDDAIIAYDLAETVRNMGHKVCGTATTMEAALATAKTCHPTLALMDLRLAHGDSGITTAQVLRQRSSLPIIFVTAFGDELSRRGLDHLGPVIRKPFTREQIERAITQAVFAPGAEAKAPRLASLAQRDA